MQAVSCGLGDALLALLPSPASISQLQAAIDAIPEVVCTPLTDKPPLCDTEDPNNPSTPSSGPQTPLSPNSTALGGTSRRTSRRSELNDTADTTAMSETAASAGAGASRHRSSVFAGRTARSTSAAAAGALAREAAEVAAAETAAASTAVSAGLPPRPRLQAREWRALLRLPVKPTCSEAVVIACAELVGMVLCDEQLNAWIEQKLLSVPQPHTYAPPHARHTKSPSPCTCSITEFSFRYRWTDLLCTLCFPPLSQTPATDNEPPPEQVIPAGTKGKGKAPAVPAPPPVPVPDPLFPQYSESIRTAALHAVDAALSDAALERALRQKLLMHVLEACILTDGAASTAAAAALLRRVVTLEVCAMYFTVVIHCITCSPPQVQNSGASGYYRIGTDCLGMLAICQDLGDDAHYASCPSPVSTLGCV